MTTKETSSPKASSITCCLNLRDKHKMTLYREHRRKLTRAQAPLIFAVVSLAAIASLTLFLYISAPKWEIFQHEGNVECEDCE